MKQQAFQFLSKIKPFSFLPADELQTVAEIITQENYAKDTVLSVQEKSELENILIVREGTIELFYDKEGKRILSGSVKPGQVCNGMGILMNAGIAVRTAITGEDTLLFVIPKKQFLDICTQFKAFHDFFVKIYSRLMRDETYSSVMLAGQAFQFLSGIAPFSFLPEKEVRKIASQIFIAHYPKDKILFVQGRSKVEYLYVVQKGAVERYYEENSQKKLYGVLSEGDIYGGISILLHNSISIRTLKLIEKSYFYLLPKKVFSDICQQYEIFSEFFTDTFGKRMLDRFYAGIVANTMQSKEGVLQFFNQTVSNIYNKDIIFCEKRLAIQEAAFVMSMHRCGSLFIKDGEAFVGIVTNHDLRDKVIAKGYDIQKPAADIMSSPLCTISVNALVFEAMMRMIQGNVKHLAVTDGADKVIGVISNHDLLTAQTQSPFFLLREISEAESREEITEKQHQFPSVIKHLIHNGVKARNINRIITMFSDAVLKRLIQFALREMGPPPAKFVFMIMGSEGRKEQTLKTDQDNAIIFKDVGKESEASVQAYFLKLGEYICTWLNDAGYEFCEGDNMAKNPRWCCALSVWKEYFSKWIHTAEPEDLLQASIFFDFRGAYGDMELISELRHSLFDALDGWSGFFRYLAQNALYFKPPLGFFRNFVLESKGKHRDTFDIKSAMMPIVDFARIHALKNKIKETNTLERMHQLYLNKVLSWEDYNELEQAYGFLMQLRFVRQVTAVIEENAKPDNYINPKKLSNIEQTMLKEIFKRIEKFQGKLNFDFIGIM